MTRQWGASGVTDLGPGLSTRIKESIKKSVFDGHQTSCPEELFVALDSAAGFYRSCAQMRAESLPAAVRHNLKLTLKASLRLNDRLNDLDGNSRQLLDEVTRHEVDSNGRLIVIKNLSPLIIALNEAYNLAKQYPKKGNLPWVHRRWLARDIVDALREHLKIDPEADVESGAKSTFISILSVVFEEVATGEKIDFPKLAQDALTLDVKSAGHYYPPRKTD